MAPPSAELLQQVAELRVRGLSWESIAQTVQRKANTLRDWPRRYRARWRAAERAARRLVAEEAAAESVLTLRRQLRSDDDKTSRAAAESLLKHTVATGRSSRPPRTLPARDTPRSRGGSEDSARRRSGRPSAALQVAQFVEGLNDAEATALLEELADRSQPPAAESAAASPDSSRSA